MPRRHEASGWTGQYGELHGRARSLQTLLFRELPHSLCATEIAGAVTSMTPRKCRACDDCIRLAGQLKGL